ncbi:MAG: hypothetical protein Q8R28_23710, partial [Dehalococcoidia bacterium]|nr:hypothetical protein [Dehalococcoidia bacterium]
NDADNAIALVLSLPKGGTITKVGAYCFGVTGDPPPYYIGIFTIDPTTGLPTTTPYGGSSGTDTVDFTAAGWVWVTLGTPATVVNAGDLVALILKPTATAPDAGNCAIVKSSAIRGLGGPPRGLQWTASWAGLTTINAMALEYSDGAVAGIPLINTTSVGDLFGPLTDPDEQGNQFTVGIDMSCVGFEYVLVGTPSDGHYTIRLYDAADGILGTYDVADEDEPGGASANIRKDWAAPVRLTAGATYRIAIEAISGSANYGFYQYRVESANAKSAFQEGSRWQATERQNHGAWSQHDAWIRSIAIVIDGVYPPPST